MNPPAACLRIALMKPSANRTSMKAVQAVEGGACTMVYLVQAMARGDQVALSRVYRQTVGQVFGIARAILGSKEDAEEVVCDVYAYAWQHADSYDESRGSVATWLTIIARSRAIDRRRQQRDHVSLDETRFEALAGSLIDEQLDPEKVLSQSQAGGALHVALESLTPRRRQLIDLAFFHGLSHQELAVAIGMRLGTVKSHLRRSLAALQDRLAGHE
jgi:RNA polymerase sigma-70 factor (ECF subfamily)